METNFLKSTLAEESRSYGFTIAFWGSGAVLIKAYSIPQFQEAFAYGIGAVIGFALLTIFTYRNTLGTADYQENNLMVLSMVHYFASLIPIAAARLIVEFASGNTSFFLSGFSVSLLYNLGMIIEIAVAEEARTLENKLFEKLG